MKRNVFRISNSYEKLIYERFLNWNYFAKSVAHDVANFFLPSDLSRLTEITLVLPAHLFCIEVAVQSWL